MQPGIVFLPHANLEYSQLRPERRGWVARESYAAILDLAEREGVPMGFEASGQTLEIIAATAPAVLEKLKAGIREGRIEAVGSPQTHVMLANLPPELGLHTLRTGLDTWERLTGVRPVTGWNPECGWASFIPAIFRAAGYETLVGDADAYFLSVVPGLRQAIGLAYDVRSHSNKTALFKIEQEIDGRPELLEPLFRPSRLSNGLNVILRSDMLCNILLWYILGSTEGHGATAVTAEDVRTTLARWGARIPGGDGFLLPYAEDAEFVGTTALPGPGSPPGMRCFDRAPCSVARFEHVLQIARELGFRLLTPRQAVMAHAAMPARGFEAIENGSAWHGGTARAWTNTPQARLLDPVCHAVYDGVHAVAAHLGGEEPARDGELQAVLCHIAAAQVSDARWPPQPASPGRFNVGEALAALEQANDALAAFMAKRGLETHRSLYSPGIMRTQIAAIREELMALPYWEERTLGAPGREVCVPAVAIEGK